MAKFVFLDRDGTLNRDPGYLRDPNALEILPGVAAGLGALRRAGFSLVIVSNQSAIGRGLATFDEVNAVNARLSELLKGDDSDAWLDAILFCPHVPEDRCGCRKPLPGLLATWRTFSAAELHQSWFVGDKVSDLECGRNVGLPHAHCLFVATGEGRLEELEVSDAQICKDFQEVVDTILAG